VSRASPRRRADPSPRSRSRALPDGKPKRAAALRYLGAGAPKVVATGRGLIAERIAATARQAGVPVHQDAALAEALGALELGYEIPEDLYVAVAEALVWAYRLDTRGRATPG
jgi:flagellar biosynthesis protein